jgi:hypothetical protein
MKLCAKVAAAMRQHPVTVRAFSLVAGARPNTVLLKFAMSEDRSTALQGRKGLAGTNLDMDEDLMPAQQTCTSKLLPLFKEAKATSKRTF